MHTWMGQEPQDKDTPWDLISDLHNLKLTNSAALNVWCNRKADMSRKQGYSDPIADVYPNKKWAIYTTTPVTRKITGALTYNIVAPMGTETLEQCIYKKYGICSMKLGETDTARLNAFTKKAKPHL
jgi:hypothetical protein